MKICTLCNVEKSKNEFAWQNKEKNILQSACRLCRKQIDKNFWKNNKQRIGPAKNARSEKRRKENQAFILKFKDKPCKDCCQSYPHFVMDFDHLSNKEFNISDNYHKNLDDLLTEIAKCDVICSNCHRIRTFTRNSLTEKAS